MGKIYDPRGIPGVRTWSRSGQGVTVNTFWLCSVAWPNPWSCPFRTVASCLFVWPSLGAWLRWDTADSVAWLDRNRRRSPRWLAWPESARTGIKATPLGFTPPGSLAAAPTAPTSLVCRHAHGLTAMLSLDPQR
jgi:hypothetical protein